MVRFELLERLEKLDYYNELQTSGIIPMVHICHKEIYEFYKSQTNQEGLEAKTITAEKYNITERSVYLIIKKMRSC